MKEDIILIGGGGHCRACIDVIERHGGYQIKGIIDRKDKLRQNILGYEVIGTDLDLSMIIKTVKKYLITIGYIKTVEKREKLYSELSQLHAELPIITSPLAYVSRHAKIKEGSIIMHGAIINAGATIGSNCIINTDALIEHDAIIGNHCHISTGATINGEAQVCDGCFIGSNATVCETRKICGHTVIGAGATIIRNIDEPGTYIGNPAKRIK